MIDFEADSSKLVLALLKDERIRQKLHLMAMRSTDNEADAEDLVAECMQYLLDPAKNPWVPERCTFLTHMGRLLRHVWAEHMRSARVRREFSDENIAFDIGTRSNEPAADEELGRRRAVARRRDLGDRLLALLPPDSIARRCFEYCCQGIESREEQARLIPCEVERVYDAHEQLKYHGAKVLAQWNAEQKERMRELRARFSGSSQKELPDDAP